MDKIRYKTNYPFSFYFWILTSLVFAINSIINSDNFWGPFIFIAIYIIAAYWYLANYSGQLILTTNKIVVKYSITKYLNFEISLEGVIEYDYKKGFYDMIPGRTYGVNYYVPKICYDTLILKYKKGELELDHQEIKINTRMFQFDRFLAELSKIKKLQETDS